MKKIINPAGLRRPFSNSSHGVFVPPGAGLLVISGQVGIGPDDVIPRSVKAQAELCFETIGKILAEAGMGFEDIIRVNGYVTMREDIPAYLEVRDRYVGDPMPVSTQLIVSGFTRAEFLVEVEVTAAKAA